MTTAIEKQATVMPTVDHDADQVQRLHERVMALGREGVEIARQQLELARQAGEILIRKKASLDHGEFTPWLEKNFGQTPRQLRKYMRLHENWAAIGPMLDEEEPPTSINQALGAIATPKPKVIEPGVPGREEVIELWAQVGNILYPSNGKGQKFSVEISALGKTFTFKDHKLAWEKWNQVNEEGRPIGRHLMMVLEQKRTQSSDLPWARVTTDAPQRGVNPFKEGDLVFDTLKVIDTRVLEVDGHYCHLTTGQKVRWDRLELVCRGEKSLRAIAGEPEAVIPSEQDGRGSGRSVAGADCTEGWGDVDPGEDLSAPTSHQPVVTLKSSSKDGDDNKAIRNTPEYIWKPGLEMWNLERFDVDPMTNDSSSVPAMVRYTREENGLVQPWVIEDRPITHLFSNPDYGLNKEFVEKLEKELGAGQLEALILDKHDHRTRWCNWLIQNCTAMCLIDHPVKFEGVDQNGDDLQGSFFPSTLFYFGSLPHKFDQYYSHLGTIVCRWNAPRFDQGTPQF